MPGPIDELFGSIETRLVDLDSGEYTDVIEPEGFDEIAEWLETLARAEKSHAGRFQKALDTLDD